jgi:alginate O-acetyltransferase complex protein AlgI
VIFNTWSFAVFGVLTWTIYWTVIPQRYKPHYLVVAGAIFYFFSIPAYLALIAALGAITFITGRSMLRTEDPARERTLLTAGIIVIAGTLVAFKYSPFFGLTVNQIASRNIIPIPRLVVPLAISFFTFEFVHVLVDIRLRKIRTLDPLEFTAFTFFFPTLVAGPIKRYQSFVPQLRHITVPPAGDILRNMYRVVIGVFKKIVLADSFSVLAQPIVTPGAPFHRFDYWIAFFAYAGKIYFDFSGYSDIAIGVAGMLGLSIPENFERPYWSPNIAVFWRRWHISLSTWIRDYIFIPLGGSRRPPAIVLLNLFVAMALAGLWHGAAWTFVIWGTWHGAGLAVHRLWARYVVPKYALLRSHGRFVTTISIAITFIFVCLGWVLFAATSLPNAAFVYHSMFL